MASELALSEHEQRQAAHVALLHDIGKLALPDSILSKPRPLSHEETALMRCHPENGERIVGAIPELAHLAPDLRAEHERWDGAGYPDGLSGEEIPIASRIVFVCDAWDAMTSDRPYRRRMTRDAAVVELATGAASAVLRRLRAGAVRRARAGLSPREPRAAQATGVGAGGSEGSEASSGDGSPPARVRACARRW